ncbi:hypothetical protein [Pararhodobacter sp. SW119]|uniref:hypothetical protein n=1 Tax=Pararhodobacter sp. SW119 TaxID=2780075 RepID=UPI001AE0B60A|nr:hypothetical protein [Pararhodobacter sp. SW119]
MAQPGSGGRGAFGFILGAVVVVVAGLVWYIATDGNMFGRNEASITIELPD